jgi:hypothetical protein
MSDNERDKIAARLIENWIDEKQELEDTNQSADAATIGEDELLRLLSAAQRSPMPEMTDFEAHQMLERARSRMRPNNARRSAISYIITGRRLAITAAALLAFLLMGSVLRMTMSSRPTPESVPGVVMKEVLYESEHAGKVVRFEMTIYRTKQNQKEASHVPSH